MNRNTYLIARPPDWEIIEHFYRGVEGGTEKIERLKQYCSDSTGLAPHSMHRACYALVNSEFLFDRHLRLNREFVWTDENLAKLIKLDQHIRKLEYEMYQKFVQIKQNLDGLIAQGCAFYKDYQVMGRICYDAMYIDDEEHEQKYGWVQGLLQDYADMEALESFTFGDGEDPDDPRDNDDYIFEAWGKWLECDYFVKNGMVMFLDHLMDDMSHSLYTCEDIVNMDLRCFYLDYDISF